MCVTMFVCIYTHEMKDRVPCERIKKRKAVNQNHFSNTTPFFNFILRLLSKVIINFWPYALKQ